MISNQNNKNKKAFTLVELAIVLLVIGILAGIVLRNMGGFTAQARDSRRLSDLRTTSVYLQNYFLRFNTFPTVTDGASWTELERIIATAGISNSLPKDPAGKEYSYYACKKSTTDRIYNVAVLRAEMETATSQNPELYSYSMRSTSGILVECATNSRITNQNQTPAGSSTLCNSAYAFCLAVY